MELIDKLKRKWKEAGRILCSLCGEYDKPENIMEIYDNRYHYYTHYHKSCLHEICSNPEDYTADQVRQASTILLKIKELKEFKARADEQREKQYKQDITYLKKHCSEVE